MTANTHNCNNSFNNSLAKSHCDVPNHACKCCNVNSNVDGYCSRIILHDIKVTSESATLGTIFYDLDRDSVYFQNSRGEELQMAQFIRGGASNTVNTSIFRPVNKKWWVKTISYIVGNVVYSGLAVYIALRINKGSNPESSPLDWALFIDLKELVNNSTFIGISPNPRGPWNGLTTYKQGDIVSIKSKLYWSQRNNINKNPVESPPDWILYFDFSDIIKSHELDDLCKSCKPKHCNVTITPPINSITTINSADVDELDTPRHDFFECDTVEKSVQPTLWMIDIQFDKDACTILDGELYTCLISHRSSYANRPSISQFNWRYENNIEHKESQIYLLLIHSVNNLELNPCTGCNRQRFSLKGEYDFDADNPHSPIITNIANSSAHVQIPLTNLQYIVNINRNIFSTNLNNIRILRGGWYKVSYNMAYSGNVHSVCASIYKEHGRNVNEIEASKSSATSSEWMRNINHSFPVNLETGDVLEIRLHVIPLARDSNNTQQFKLYPHKTWYHIQSI
jgi:hypothetical protein